MLCLKTNEGNTSVKVHGNFVQICSDLCVCVRALYDSLEDKELQEMFRQFARDMLPVLPFEDETKFQFQDDTELQEEKKKTDEAIGKVLGDDIVKKLSELVEMLK